jgi:hypothetical protein
MSEQEDWIREDAREQLDKEGKRWTGVAVFAMTMYSERGMREKYVDIRKRKALYSSKMENARDMQM